MAEGCGGNARAPIHGGNKERIPARGEVRGVISAERATTRRAERCVSRSSEQASLPAAGRIRRRLKTRRTAAARR
jgi:hypothetical protein